MKNKKNIKILSSILFEPYGNVDNDEIYLNLNSIPCINKITTKIIDYCSNEEELKYFFFKNQGNYLKKYLINKLPVEITENIISYLKQIKNYILHLIYNNWYLNFKNILKSINDDYELYSVWNNDYNHKIFENVEMKMQETNNKFKELISKIDKNQL